MDKAETEKAKGERKPWFVAVLVVAAIFIVILAAMPLAFMDRPGIGKLRPSQKRERMLLKPGIYTPTAYRLARYCQSDAQLLPDFLGQAWMPAELRDAGYCRAEISTNWATVEFGGGFHHFGYRLSLADEQPRQDTRRWTFRCYVTGEPDHKLMAFDLAVTNTFTEAQLIASVKRGYAELLAKNPQDEPARLGELFLLLRFGRLDEAIATTEAWREKAPSDWLPRMTLAHLRARAGDLRGGALAFTDWVDENPSYDHFMYLFIFNVHEGRELEAVEAIRRSHRQPYGKPGPEMANRQALSLNAATYALQQEEYDLCLDVCRRVLEASDPTDEATARAALQLRAAALFLSGDTLAAQALIPSFNTTKSDDLAQAMAPVERARLDRFTEALRAGESKFLHEPANWQSRTSGWFSPYTMDETRMAGRTDLPSLFPVDH